jgi:hypothetical protein
MEVTLTAEEWDSPPPSCEMCDRRESMDQEFKPFGIGGSVHGRAAKIAEDIIANDFNVANFQSDRRRGGTPKVRYKDQSDLVQPSNWQAAQGHKAMLEAAISIGKQNRRQFGDGLDMLQRGIKSGAQPDLIANSKKKAIRVW